MKTKSKLILCLLGVCLTCVGFCACATSTKINEYEKKGYMIKVSYLANGGTYLGREGISIVDMFKPSDYVKDDNGYVHIKLTEPTDNKRPSGGSDTIYLTKSGYFYADWYQNREIVTNENGVVVDENGNELEVLSAQDGTYKIKDSEKVVLATPAYTYSNRWDFENDTIDFNANENKAFEMTLYPAWVKLFEFEYYCKNENEEWVKYGTNTTFDYKTNLINQGDNNTIWLPNWEGSDGSMNYSHLYKNSDMYNFPKKSGTTFVKAYSDEKCENQINESFVHTGYVNKDNGKAVDRVQKIYVELSNGEQYRISTAQQLIDCADTNGLYEILNDINFENKSWPTVFMGGTFKGTFNGYGHTISNINAKYSSTSVEYCGMFGKVDEKANISNVNFENVTFNIAKAMPVKLAPDIYLGMFAGFVDEKANISNVKISGTVKLGVVSLDNRCNFNLIGNGNLSGVEVTNKIGLVVYGEDLIDYFEYTIKTESVAVDEQLNVTFSKAYSEEDTNKEQSETIINY